MKKHLLFVPVLMCSSGALALDASELASLKDVVQEMCVFPDRTGEYLQTEGEIKVGAPILIKIVNGALSGKLAYEKWRGIPVTLDKYKTDPRQCAVEILRILQPVLASTKDTEKERSVHQTTSGPNSPNVSGVNGNINFDFSGQGSK